ncbi:glycosyltransferase [Priestia aryabhattai]|uniref:Glycosyltransferase n=1 Tax=Priestia megaterium TaxID=1404 RepID=A0AAX6BT50_PRIMG|nr:glycosyltransferase [Priestia megaterium]GMG76894.1 glycosyltransferase [Priestia megaterium]
MSKVSIVVPFFNCSYIDHALDSITKQTYTNIETIVVNDGSTKHTDKILPYLDKITYVSKENGGTASALNTGIQQATGDYICWLSSDDIYDPQKIAIQLESMKTHNAFFSHTNYYAINYRGRIISPPLGIQTLSKLDLITRISKGNIINGCSIMIHKDVFNHVGLFDETLLYTHDYDLWLRIIQVFDLQYISHPLLLSRIHESMGSKKYASFIKEENKIVINRHKYVMEQLALRYKESFE